MTAQLEEFSRALELYYHKADKMWPALMGKISPCDVYTPDERLIVKTGEEVKQHHCDAIIKAQGFVLRWQAAD